MSFREMDENEIDRLSDEEIIEYVVAARDAGKVDAAVTAASLLAYRYERHVTGYVRKRIGDMGETACEEAVERTMIAAFASVGKFEGATVAEFRAWLFQIAARRGVADQLRRKYRSVGEVPLVWERGDGGEQIDREFGGGDPLAAIDDSSVIQQAYDELSPEHKLVIELVRFRDLPHAEAAIEVNRQFGDALSDPMTDQNVSQINSRFKKRLRQLFDEAEDPPRGGDNDE